MIRVFIEAEAGSREKHMYDEATLKPKGVRRACRPYPYPYGFVVGTAGGAQDEGDGLDCYVITARRPRAGATVECEPAGLLEMTEDGEPDHKLLAVDPGSEIAIAESVADELRDFIYGVFSRYPEVRVEVGRRLPRQAALDLLAARLEGPARAAGSAAPRR